MNVEKTTDKFLGIAIFMAIVAALTPVVLVYAGNLSTSGIGLATLLSATFIGLLLGIFVVKAIIKTLK